MVLKGETRTKHKALPSVCLSVLTLLPFNSCLSVCVTFFLHTRKTSDPHPLSLFYGFCCRVSEFKSRESKEGPRHPQPPDWQEELRQTDRQTEKQTDRQTNRQTQHRRRDRQTDAQADI
mmetsp:Transcript_13656/g.27148  ORF Transcript_13656/g.27148 Transcript_13656/m.27148 type:complete len:119 (-) Transcript_13656:749-1105(-)